MSNDLIVLKVDKARMLLAEARDATDAKKVADLARAAEVYARRQKLGDECIQYATSVKIDAMTMMGEFLKTAPKNKGANGVQFTGNKMEPVKDDTPTLKESGLSKRESSEAQALADIKEKKPELYEQVRNGTAKVHAAVSEVKREEKTQATKAKAQQAKESATYGKQPWKIIQGDCIEELAKIKAGTVNLIFADPPYNIGVDYDDGEKADRLPDHAFASWCGQWIDLCVKALAPNGTFWLLINDEWADVLGCELRRSGLHRRAWVKWYETFGVNCTNNFNRCSRHLFYCVKNPKRFVFNAEAVNRPSDRQTKYADKRAAPGGKIWDDVWEIPRLVGNAAERMPGFPTQLPLELLRPIVGCCSELGDFVLDPFCGSATTGVAAVELGRTFIGIEKQERFVELAGLRLTGSI